VTWELIHGESLAILRTLSDASVDAVITDPPYSSGGQSAGARAAEPAQKYGTTRTYPTFTGDNRDQRGWAFWCALWLSECLRIARPGSPIVMFCDWRQLPLATDVLQAGGWVWRGTLPWVKPGARPQKGRFTNQAEYAVWGSAGPMPAHRGVGVLPGAFQHPVKQADKFHLTGKPTALMGEIVRICVPGGTILDPFAGSGTTGVAAIHHGYSFIGIERELAYVEVSRQRLIEAATNA
jgi:site-specific DNA-methyltransferase (adenine-specific)